MADTVTTGGSLSLAITFQLRKETIPIVRTRLVYAQFGQDGKILPGTDMIRFVKKPDLAADTSFLADEVTNPTPEALPAITKVDITSREIGRVVSISRRATNMSPLELVAWAKDTLAFDAARRMDYEVKEVLKTGGTLMQTNGTLNTRNTISANMTAADIRKSLIKLQALDLDTSMNITAVTHPFVVGDLMGEATNPGGWLAVHQYGAPGNILNGEVGRLYNTSFMTTTNAIKFAGAGSGAVDIYATMIGLGPWAFGKANIEDLRFTAVPPTPDHADALGRRWLLGYYMDWGVGIIDSTKFIRYESAASAV